MKIKQKSIQEIIEKISIVELISMYTELKNTGRNYSGLCPFHDEDTPSFTVNPEKKLYHCFGCKAGGNLIQFVMEKENLTFVESIEFLADRFSIDIEYEGEGKADDEKQSLFLLMKKVTRSYSENIKENANALKFLKSRKISERIIREFELGYSKGDLLRKFDDVENLIKLGVFVKKNDVFEALNGRVVFPIMDKYGRTVGFGGRVLEGKKYKYLNSPATVLYDKSKILYGLNVARNNIKEKDFSIVCEGFIDCLRLHEAGFQNSVATLGTNFSNYQLKELARLSKNIILAYDGDKAGQEACYDICERVQELDLNLKIVTFPDESDPDEFIKNRGIKDFINLLKTSEFYVDFYLKQYLIETNDIYIKGENIRKCISFIENIKDKFLKHEYIKRLESFFNIKYKDLVKVEKKNETKSTEKRLNIRKKPLKTEKDININIKKIIKMSLIYNKALEIIFKKFYKSIDDKYLKSIILKLYRGFSIAEVISLEIPESYKELLIKYEFEQEKIIEEDMLESEIELIFNRMSEGKLVEEIDRINSILNSIHPEDDEYEKLISKNFKLHKKLKALKEKIIN